eukprot:2508151-Rhodomonas_salina.1
MMRVAEDATWSLTTCQVPEHARQSLSGRREEGIKLGVFESEHGVHLMRRTVTQAECWTLLVREGTGRGCTRGRVIATNLKARSGT